MTNDDHSESGWTPCETGEIRRFVRRLKWERRQPVVLRVAGACAGILVAMTAIAVMRSTAPQHDGKYPFGGITCTEVRSYGQEYLMGDLEPPLRRKIEAHLAECPECGSLFRDMMNGNSMTGRQPPATDGSGMRSVLFGALPRSTCGCPECRSAAARTAAHDRSRASLLGVRIARNWPE